MQVGIGPRRLIGSVARGESFGAKAVGCSRSNSPGGMLKCLAKGRLDDDDFDEDAARYVTPGLLLLMGDRSALTLIKVGLAQVFERMVMQEEVVDDDQEAWGALTHEKRH